MNRCDRKKITYLKKWTGEIVNRRKPLSVHHLHKQSSNLRLQFSCLRHLLLYLDKAPQLGLVSIVWTTTKEMCAHHVDTKSKTKSVKDVWASKPTVTNAD